MKRLLILILFIMCYFRCFSQNGYQPIAGGTYLTVASLSTRGDSDGVIVNVKGFYGSIDGSGGRFIMRKSTPGLLNVPGHIIQVGGTADHWQRLLDGDDKIFASSFGLKGDGTNETQLIQTASDYTAKLGKILYFDNPIAKYKVINSINITNDNSNWEFASGATIDASSVTGSTPGVLITGAPTNYHIDSVATNFKLGDSVLTLNQTTGLNTGDYIIIESSGEVFDPMRPLFKSEMTRIKKINGNQITIWGTIMDNYDTNNFKVYINKLNPVKNVSITGLTIKFAGQQAKQYGFITQQAVGVRLKSCTLDSSGVFGIMAQYCYDIKIEECKVTNTNYSGYGYGIQFGSVFDGRILNNTLVNCRHGIDLGGTFICRQILISNNHVFNCSSSGISTHSASEYVTISNNQINFCGGGIVIRGPRNLVYGNTVTGYNNTLESYNQGILIGDGPGHLDLGGGIAGVGNDIHDNQIFLYGSNASLNEGLRSYCRLISTKIHDNQFYGFTGNGIYLRGDGNKNSEIYNNLIDCSSQLNTNSSGSLNGIYSSPMNVTATRGDTNIMILRNVIIKPLYSGIEWQGGRSQLTSANNIVIEKNTVDGAGVRGIDIGLGSTYYATVYVIGNQIKLADSASLYINTSNHINNLMRYNNIQYKVSQTIASVADGPVPSYTGKQITSLIGNIDGSLLWNLDTKKYNYKSSTTWKAVLDSATADSRFVQKGLNTQYTEYVTLGNYTVTSTNGLEQNLVYAPTTSGTISLPSPTANMVVEISNTTLSPISYNQNLYKTNSIFTNQTDPSKSVKLIWIASQLKWYLF